MALPHLRDVPVPALPERLAAAGVTNPERAAGVVGLAVHRDGVMSWDEIPVGRDTKRRLTEHFDFDPLLTPAGHRLGGDGATTKSMFRLRSGESIEAVLIRHWGDHTLCISSQAGCAMACSFCATGTMGLARNLTAGEITEQAVRVQKDAGVRVTDVVFMGMGEPLHNYDPVMDACTNLNDRRGHGISRRRITVSTAGLVPGIRRFTAERQRWRLHLSLHSAIQATRERLMPIAKLHPLPELIEAMREHQRLLAVKWLTFQYVAIPGVNMDRDHVDAMREELTGLRYILNVIPWNDTGAGFRPPSWDEVREFTGRLRALGCPVKVRYSAGKQDGMGCGQLSAETLAAAPALAGSHMAAPPGDLHAMRPGTGPAVAVFAAVLAVSGGLGFLLYEAGKAPEPATPETAGPSAAPVRPKVRVREPDPPPPPPPPPPPMLRPREPIAPDAGPRFTVASHDDLKLRDWKEVAAAYEGMRAIFRDMAEKGMPSPEDGKRVEMVQTHGIRFQMAAFDRPSGWEEPARVTTMDHPAFAANLIAAVLDRAKLPLTDAQAKRLGDLARERSVLADEADAALDAEDAGYYLDRFAARARVGESFHAEAFSVLTPAQAVAVTPDEHRNHARLDPASPAVMWSRACRPIRFVDADQFADVVANGLAADLDLRDRHDEIRVIVGAWARAGSPEGPDVFEQRGFLKGSRIAADVRRMVTLLRSLVEEMKLEPETAAKAAGIRAAFVPLRP